MRLPKTVNISGKTYIVNKNKKIWGGSCRNGSQKIVVGTSQDQSSQRIFTNYVHEVLEAVTLERKYRYEAGDEEVVFVMTHKQFDAFAKDVATALKPMDC